MIKLEFNKMYIYWLCLMIFSLCLVVTGIVLTIVVGVASIAITIVAVLLALYCLFKFLVFKKQHLTLSKEGMDAYIVTYRGAQKPSRLNTPLSHIKRSYVKGGKLILLNDNNQELTVYNVKNVDKASTDINNFLSSNY